MAEMRFLNSAGATVMINGVERDSATVSCGETVAWEVSKEGYVTQAGELEVWEDTTVPVTLELERLAVSFRVSPADAVLKVNGAVRELDGGSCSVTVRWGDTLSWSCSADGHAPQADSFTVTEACAVCVELAAEESGPDRTVTFVVLTEGASLTVNGEEVPLDGGVAAVEACDGDVIEWSCSAVGYVTRCGTLEVSGNVRIYVALEAEAPDRTVTFVVSPAGASLEINGEAAELSDGRYSVTARDGDVIAWAASADGYAAQSGSFTVDGDVVMTVVLEAAEPSPEPEPEPEYATFTISAEPDTATVVIDGEERTSVTVEKGTDVGWSVGAVGYVPQSGTHTVTEDFTLDVRLETAYHTLTVRPDPADATVTLNGAVGASGTFAYGTVVEWTVSMEGYVTKSGTETVTGDRTIDVVLEEAEPEYATLTIATMPIDATVVIDGEERSEITVAVGTTVEWSVSKDGYVTQSGTYTVTEDYAMVVTLSVEPYLTVEPSSLHFGTAASAGFIDVDSTSAWSVEMPGLTGWLTLSATSGGAGSTRITVSASENTFTMERSETLTFTNEDGLTAEFAATQAAASGGDDPDPYPDPEPVEDSITLSGSSVSSGEWFTLAVEGSASLLTAALYNEAATIDEIVLRFGGNDGTDYVLTDKGSLISVVPGGTYQCRVNNTHTQAVDVQFTYGGAAALLRVESGGTLPTAGGGSETETAGA